MNRIYSLVWSRARGLWMVAHEGSASRGKAGGTRQNRRSGALAVALLALGEFSSLSHAAPAANALPAGAQVSVGQAELKTSLQNGGARLDVNQGSQRAILSWSTFDIGASAQVNFNQPNSSAVALNRVLSSDPSQIFGALNANGQVFLINSNGVIFGQSASVNVGGMVASTLSISDRDFLAGQYRFTRNATTAGILNQGALTAAPGGYLALLAPEVRNQGVITAQLGSIAMAAGDAMTLNLSGDRLVNVIVDPAHIAALVDNSGIIRADGGTVLLSALAADRLIGAAINTTGIIEAQGFSDRGGTIVLDGGSNATVTVSGMLDASDARTGQRGGFVKVLGDRVGLLDHARIDVSGFSGGGAALIGGNWQGQGPEHNARLTFVGNDASIRADALAAGNGGTVVVWADGTTRFHGSISANGGATQGNGGQVETSGKDRLDIDGARVSALATGGTNGTWLLDPTSIDVVSTGKLFAYPGDVDQFSDFDLGGKGLGTRIAPAELAAAKASVVLQAQNTITFSNAVTLTFAGAGLTAQAGGSIIVNAGITTNNGQITLSANDPGGTRSATASVTGAGALNAGSGPITVNTNGSSGGISLTGNISSSAASTFQTGAGALSLTASGNSFGSSVRVSNTGANAVALTATSAVNLQTSTVGGDLTVTSGSDIQLLGAVGVGGNAVLNAGGGIVLEAALTAGDTPTLVAAGNFTNRAGAAAFALAPGWRVYSQSPLNNLTGGLVSDFTGYNCAYGSGCAGIPLPAGRLFLYAAAAPSKLKPVAPATPVVPDTSRLALAKLLFGPQILPTKPPPEHPLAPALPVQQPVTRVLSSAGAPIQSSSNAVGDGVQGLYVQYFGRPADPIGLAYWKSVVEAGMASGSDMATAMAGVSNAFSNSAEFTAQYTGLNDNQKVTAVVQNMFGRAPSPNELVYWTQKLSTGAMSIAQISDAIGRAAMEGGGPDAEVMTARTNAAITFTDGLTTSEQMLAYTGATAGSIAREFVASITADSLTPPNAPDVK